MHPRSRSTLPATHALDLHPRRAAFLLGVVVAALLALHAVAVVYRHSSFTRAERLIAKFDLNGEQTLPVFVTCVMLLGCAVLLAWAGLGEAARLWRWMWFGLAGVFALMSLDEMASIHELMNRPVARAMHGAQGMLYFPWVLPAAAAVAVLGLAYVPFLLRLPRPYGALFVLSGLIYVGGAIGMELPGASLAYRGEAGAPLYGVVTTVEEVLELLGISVFLVTLLSYVGRYGRPLVLSVRPSNTA